MKAENCAFLLLLHLASNLKKAHVIEHLKNVERVSDHEI